MTFNFIIKAWNIKNKDVYWGDKKKEIKCVFLDENNKCSNLERKSHIKIRKFNICFNGSIKKFESINHDIKPQRLKV